MNEQPVLVEYTFSGLSQRAARDLPQRVEAAIDSLVRRERLPSDEDVRAIVHGVAQQETRTGSQTGSQEQLVDENHDLSVQVMLPHEIAVGLAMHRSFHTVQPRPVEPLTVVELRTLTHRSRRTRLRIVRRRMAARQPARHAPTTCVICLNPVRCIATRLVLECEHEFHRDCITEWINTSRMCPTCRSDVDLTPRVDEMHILNARRTRYGRDFADDDTESELEEDTVVNF